MSDDVRGIGDNNPPGPILDLSAIDPEKLLVIPVDQIAPMLDVQYSDLQSRSAELLAAALRWMQDHDNGHKPIADEDDNLRTSDFMRQIAQFAGDTGEVEVARKAVKLGIFQAGQAIDAWFGNLRTKLMMMHGPSKSPPVDTMQYASTAFLVAKARREQAERDRIAREAQEEARRKAEEARLAAEANRPPEVIEQATEEALEAEVVAAQVTQDAAAPARTMVSARSATGTHVGLRGTWDAQVVDMVALCRAVADGKAPVTFVTADMSAIRQAVRRKVSPMRECAGLAITEAFAASRRGA